MVLWGRLYAGQRYFDRHIRGVPALVGRGKPGPTKRIGAVVLWGRLYAGLRCFDRHSRGVTAPFGRAGPAC